MELWGYSLPFWESVFRWATGIAAIAGGIGVTAAFISAIVGYQITDRVAKESDKKISEANARAEEAKATSAQANERAAQAEARAAEANLELARFKAPRSLSKSQQDSLRDKLKGFSGISVDVFRFGETSEIVVLSTLLVSPLKDAGWSPRDWGITGGGAATGVLVMTRPGSNSTVELAAAALVRALNEVGIASNKHPSPEGWGDWTNVPGMAMGPNWEKDKVAPIRIVIGSKP